MISTRQKLFNLPPIIVIKATHWIAGSSCHSCYLTDLMNSGVSIVMDQIVSASNSNKILTNYDIEVGFSPAERGFQAL